MNPPTEKAESGKLKAESGDKLEVAIQRTEGSDRTREFERLPRESAKAYAAFKVYLDAGPQRSLEMVSRKLGKSKALMERWSRRYDWVGRVAAYGAYVAEVERRAIEQAAVQNAVEWQKMLEPLRREAWSEAEKAIEMVREARERWVKSGRAPGFEGMARMLELAFKLKQFAAGVDGNVRGDGDTNVAVNVDVSLALEKIYGEPLVLADGHRESVDGGSLMVDRPEVKQLEAGSETPAGRSATGATVGSGALGEAALPGGEA
jgi:hypothetical protein